MTRINSILQVSNLTDEHLLAEHREIKRICSRFSKRLLLNKFDDIPKNFTLGKGHEIFFLDKGHFTLTRYKLIHLECIRRGFKVQNYESNWKVYKDTKYFNGWTDNGLELILNRIKERITNSTEQFHYYSKKISKQQAIELLWK